MTENEKAFFAWYEKIQEYKDNYNLRMAFDAGYAANQLPQSELGRMEEATILNILSKSLADGKLSKKAFDGLRYKLNAEKDFRIALAEKISVKLLPICICEKCDNLEEGRLIQNVIQLILEGN